MELIRHQLRRITLMESTKFRLMDRISPCKTKMPKHIRVVYLIILHLPNNSKCINSSNLSLTLYLLCLDKEQRRRKFKAIVVNSLKDNPMQMDHSILVKLRETTPNPLHLMIRGLVGMEPRSQQILTRGSKLRLINNLLKGILVKIGTTSHLNRFIINSCINNKILQTWDKAITCKFKIQPK